MKIIGLTGNIGSGKSTVSKILASNGCKIIDADKIGHEILQKGKSAYSEVVAIFGTDILDDQEEINRKRLGEIVFTDSEKLATLTEITHTYIVKEILGSIKLASTEDYPFIVIDAPLLYEASLDIYCDKVIVVIAQPEIRLSRIISRDGLDTQQAQNRINTQKGESEFIKLGDFIIENNGDIETLDQTVTHILDTIGS